MDDADETRPDLFEADALARFRHQLEQAGLAPRVEGFVAWPGPLADVGLNAAALAFAALLVPRAPQVGLLMVALVLAASVFQRRGRILLRHLLPRRRAYNVVARVGEGPPVVAFAFADRASRFGRVARALEPGVGAAGLALAVIALLRWGGVEVGLVDLVHYALTASFVLVGVCVLAAALGRRPMADARPLDRLVELAERPPPGVELWIVGCGAGWPWLDGLRALEEQHRHRLGPEARWLYIGGDAPARAWLARRRLPALEVDGVRGFFADEYDAPDVAREHSAGRDPVGDGDRT